MKICKDETVLPRYKLANQQAIFDELLEIANKSQSDESDGVWSLLMDL